MTEAPWFQHLAAIAIAAGAAAWLIRRAVRKKGESGGCEGCPAHRAPRRARERSGSATPRPRSGRA